LYLAVVLDVFSRRVVGWAMETHLRAELVLAALEMAVARRKPGDVIHHSDQGCQYTSIAFGNGCQALGVRPSMGRVGDAYDNAMAESFFATLECELLDRRRFKTQAEARMAVFAFIEGFYNPRRRLPPPAFLPPAAFDQRAIDPGAPHPAAVLAPVKERPGNAEPGRTDSLPAVLDRPPARRGAQGAGRDGKMIAAEPKDASKKEGKMPSDWLP